MILGYLLIFQLKKPKAREDKGHKSELGTELGLELWAPDS